MQKPLEADFQAVGLLAVATRSLAATVLGLLASLAVLIAPAHGITTEAKQAIVVDAET